MKLSQNILQLDVKVQDRFRERFAKLVNSTPKEVCVILGDSDIDYTLAPNVEDSRILSAPYSVEGIKYKLIYNGVGKNLAGEVKCFARKVNATGAIFSLYDYPTNETWTEDVLPPSLTNGKNWESVTFDDTKMGYILYFSTVLDYYLDANGVKKRYIEKYDFSIDWNGSTTKPANWDVVFDNDNGSLFLSKIDTSATIPIGTAYTGIITAIGQKSKKVKKVKFNL